MTDGLSARGRSPTRRARGPRRRHRPGDRDRAALRRPGLPPARGLHGAAEALAREGHGRARLGHEGGLVERDAMVFQAAKRIATLNAAHEGLVFGRLDLKDPAEAPRTSAGSACATRTATPCSIDWRAPAAAVFYQATPAEPQGVVRRRVLRCTGRTVVGVEDDLLDAEAGDGPAGHRRGRADRAAVPGPRPLACTRSSRRSRPSRTRRSGRPAKGVVEISGGPGTGKTVVALHRAAYLLYTDRAPLRARRRAGGRPVRGLHALHRAGAAVAGRDRGRAAVPRRGGRRHQGDPARRAGGRGRQGLGPDGRADAPGGAAGGAGRAAASSGSSTATTRSSSAAATSAGSGGSCCPRASATSRWAGSPRALVDALWRQVRGERALERGREEFVDTMLGDDAS